MNYLLCKHASVCFSFQITIIRYYTLIYFTVLHSIEKSIKISYLFYTVLYFTGITVVYF
jgi:hypothetical protein